jgi:hypothetical protein
MQKPDVAASDEASKSAFAATSRAAPLAAATQAINALGLELLARGTEADANAVLSPYSIQSALAMALAGAAGDTRAEMARVLHYGAPKCGWIIRSCSPSSTARAGRACSWGVSLIRERYEQRIGIRGVEIVGSFPVTARHFYGNIR